MKLNILEEEYIFENNEESIGLIFDKIRDLIDFEDYNFDHMIIDGKQVHDDFESYIEDNINDINEITVVLFTDREIIVDNINTAKEYIKGAIPLITDLSKDFSGTTSEKNYDDLRNLYEAMFWIVNNFKSIDGFEIKSQIITNYAIWNEVIKEVGLLEESLDELENFIDIEITVISEILSTKIVPLFKRMDENLQYIKVSL